MAYQNIRISNTFLSRWETPPEIWRWIDWQIGAFCGSLLLPSSGQSKKYTADSGSPIFRASLYDKTHGVIFPKDENMELLLNIYHSKFKLNYWKTIIKLLVSVKHSNSLWITSSLNSVIYWTVYEEVIHTALNPLNAELTPTRHLLALVGAHHILHVSRIRVNISKAINITTQLLHCSNRILTLV